MIKHVLIGGIGAGVVAIAVMIASPAKAQQYYGDGWQGRGWYGGGMMGPGMMGGGYGCPMCGYGYGMMGGGYGGYGSAAPPSGYQSQQPSQSQSPQTQPSQK